MVVVGRPALAQRLRRLVDGADEVVEVNGFLAALGEAATSRVTAVVGPVSALAGMAVSTAESLRRLAPRARLVVIEQPGGDDELRAVLDAGFDQAISEADADRGEDAALAAALDLPAPSATHKEPEIRRADPADLSDLDLGHVPPLPEPPPSYAATLDAAMPQNFEKPASSVSGSDAEVPGGTSLGRRSTPIVPGDTDDDHQLGDTDLVNLILRGNGGLEGLALRMVRAQSGLADLRLTPPGQAVPDDHIAAPVAQHEHDFGTLHTPGSQGQSGVIADQLQVWADWLVHWLRLQAQFTRLRDLAMRDELTGAWNRRYFNHFLKKILERAAEDRQQVTVMVFDIDDFKLYNDAYGHAAGDEILREVARMMSTSVRDHDVVARIGGDEFAVIFWDAGERRRPDSKHPDDVLNAAKRFQRAVVEARFPKLLDKAAGNLTISGGLAGFPWDGRTPEELLEFADAMAMRSKKQGKNAITVGPGALADSDEA